MSLKSDHEKATPVFTSCANGLELSVTDALTREFTDDLVFVFESESGSGLSLSDPADLAFFKFDTTLASSHFAGIPDASVRLRVQVSQFLESVLTATVRFGHPNDWVGSEPLEMMTLEALLSPSLPGTLACQTNFTIKEENLDDDDESTPVSVMDFECPGLMSSILSAPAGNFTLSLAVSGSNQRLNLGSTSMVIGVACTFTQTVVSPCSVTCGRGTFTTTRMVSLGVVPQKTKL